MCNRRMHKRSETRKPLLFDPNGKLRKLSYGPLISAAPYKVAFSSIKPPEAATGPSVGLNAVCWAER